jgi:hypothetical protein
MPPAPAADFTPPPASGATSRWPLVLFGVGLAGAVVYIYQHAREDEARFAELERELELAEPHPCSCGRESSAPNMYAHPCYRPT